MVAYQTQTSMTSSQIHSTLIHLNSVNQALIIPKSQSNQTLNQIQNQTCKEVCTSYKEVWALHKEVWALYKDVWSSYKEVWTFYIEVWTSYKDFCTSYKEVCTSYKEV